MSGAHGVRRGVTGGRSAPGQLNVVDRVRGSLRPLGVREGDRLCVACSGGADSIALLHLLHRAGLGELYVVHVDHGLRADSARDADFVLRVAEGLGLRGEVVEVDVAPGREGPEAAAREARYAALDHVAEAVDAAWIATAHTLDDQAETVLLRAVRGGSLGGIAPVRGRLIRPLLDVERAELRAWLSSEALEWREDPSNEDLRLERNWMRAVVLPLLRERRPGVARVLSRLASLSRDDEETLDAMAAEVVARAEVDEAGLFLPFAEIDPLPRALRTRVVRSALRRLGCDPQWSDIDAILGLAPGGRTSCAALDVWRLADGVAILKQPTPVPEPLVLPERGTLESVQWGLRLRLGSVAEPAWIWRCVVPEGAGRLVLRSREAGDRVPTPAGTKKVQDVLVDAKVPRPLRDLVPIVATKAGALAVVGITSKPGWPVRASLRAGGDTVIDAEPSHTTWSKSAAWIRANG